MEAEPGGRRKRRAGPVAGPTQHWLVQRVLHDEKIFLSMTGIGELTEILPYIIDPPESIRVSYPYVNSFLCQLDL